jgi:hypothetical protein
LFFSVVRRLKTVVDLTESPRIVLFLLDEILHGTNSHDRRRGAEAVIRSLVAHRALGIVTTHDLALTQIAETMSSQAVNKHFEDTIVDGTMTREMYPRVFAANPERQSLQRLSQPYRRAVGGLEWARYMLPMNADFYKMIKTAFIPYGVEQFGRPVYSLVFYCNIEKKKRATEFTRTAELRYGAPVDELFRLTHVAFDPERSEPAGRSRPPTDGLALAAAPTYVPTEEEMRHLEPLVGVFHPLSPYAPPTAQDDDACRALEDAFAAELAKVGATVVQSRPPFGTRAIVIRHRHAARAEKLRELARAMAGTWWVGRTHFVARVEAHSLVAGEHELSVWAWEG